MSFHKWFAFIVAAWLPVTLYAQDVYLESGDKQTVLIELYTSEGCSSCPPAERYLNGYLHHPRLWEQFIPLAFHVDYWDYLGWKDRFSDPAYSSRQRQYARGGGLSAVYTPAFVVNGQGWRPRSMRDRKPSLNLPSPGKLSVKVSDRGIIARFHSIKSYSGDMSDDLQLHVALLGMGLSTEIESGENRGRLSPHEFVVLSHSAHAASRHSGQRWKWQLPRPELDCETVPEYALVAWVSRKGEPAPLQAVGGYLPKHDMP
jgi:hypothetical protein